MRRPSVNVWSIREKPIQSMLRSFPCTSGLAERIEVAPLKRRHMVARLSLYAVLTAMLAGAAWSAVSPVSGGLLYGAALALLASWLGVYDVARRRLFFPGLSGYTATCVFGGYGWLAIAGVAWAATALDLPTRDVALHALGLGFVVSILMGHAPMILPRTARIKLQFGGFFYVPLAALYLSLFMRLGLGLAAPSLRAIGAVFNAAAIALFVATIVGSAVVWRVKNGRPGGKETK